MDNIKLFDAYTAYVFQKIYENFPKCINFEPLKELKNIQDTTNFSEEEKGIIFCETMLWLEENGFLKIKNKIPPTDRPLEPMLYQGFYCVRLTIKGLNLLSLPKPKTFDKKVGEEIISKVKQGLFTEAGKIITQSMFEFSKGML